MLYAAYFFLYFFVFLFGICIGSFLNAVIYRVPNSISFVKGRSYCPNCHTTIKPYDLIPILSFFLLRGKCRFCKGKISIRYPIVECFTGVMAILCFLTFDFSLQALVVFLFTALLIAIALIDYDTMTIPNGLLIALLPLSAALVFLFPTVGLLARIIGFAAISLPMFLLALLIRDAFGGGDIKLMAVCGFALGWQNVLLAFFFAAFTCGCYSIWLLLHKHANRKTHLAFGPYLAAGCAAALLWGSPILSAYLSLFQLV